MKLIFRLKISPSKNKIFKEILKVGLPVIVMNSIGSLTIFLLNTFINRIDDGGEGILGVYIKLQSFVFMPVFGLSQGAMPIMGYNYGANNKERFQRALKTHRHFFPCRLSRLVF
jgi:Na+-driven multidrug efflux pump